MNNAETLSWREDCPQRKVQDPPISEGVLEDRLSQPRASVLEALSGLQGDLMVLGVGGKMGPSLARMAARALAALGSPHRVIGVSNFSQPGLRDKLEDWGVKTIACDLLDRRAVQSLPDSQDVVFMVGRKFGTAEGAASTWAVNTYLPGLIAERFSPGRVVVFSTGNVYPFTPVARGGSQEQEAPAPVGEYGISALGRERVFEHFSRSRDLRCVLLRLNYAIDLRYGVLLDIAQRVRAREPIDLTTGMVNVIWGGDANAYSLSALTRCASPPSIINVTGPEMVSVYQVAQQFARAFRVPVEFVGEEASEALISNAGRAHRLFGYPEVTLIQMIEWIVAWLENDLPTWRKPTHFQVRDGSF